VRWLTRLVWIAAALAVAAVPDAVGADQSSCQPGSGPPVPNTSVAGGVNIHVTRSNTVIWCSKDVIEANSDVRDGTNYPVRATSQSPSTNPVSNAISVNKLLTIAGLNPASVNHLEIMRLTGSWSTLSNADLVNPSGQFLDGLTPVVWINDPSTWYTRPLRSPSDTNSTDQILASNGSALDVYVYSGPVLTVSAKATPSHVAKNQLVTLTARVTNPTVADGSLTYTWNFQDGTHATGASVKHSYGIPGNWYPVVTVQGQADDSGGASQPIAVTVGSAPTSTGSGPGGTSAGKHAHHGGPTHRTANAPAQAGSHKHSTTTTTTTSNTTTSTTTSATSTTAATGTSHNLPANAGPSPTTRAPAASDHRVQPQPSPGGTVVDGRLIADVVPISAVQLAHQGSQQPAQAHAPSASTGGGSITALGGIAGGCAIVALLGSGAGMELRSRRRAVNAVRTA
jgi:hypothetical protein